MRGAVRPVVIVVVLVLVAGVVAGVLLTSGHGKTATTGKGDGRPAPDFTLPGVRDGQADVTLSSLRGRPLLLNFWATWCVPCVEEMPLLQAAHKRVGDRVAFLGIDRQDFRPEAVSFLQKTGVTYPSAYDREGALDGPYRLRGTPTSVFIDADGRIRDQVTGPLTKAQLDAELTALTKGNG